jgi:hypothetical protein
MLPTSAALEISERGEVRVRIALGSQRRVDAPNATTVGGEFFEPTISETTERVRRYFLSLRGRFEVVN